MTSVTASFTAAVNTILDVILSDPCAQRSQHERLCSGGAAATEKPSLCLRLLRGGNLLRHDIDRHSFVFAMLHMTPTELLIEFRGELRVEIPGISL